MAKLFMSKKQIIKIEEFLQNYYDMIYTGQNKLTHYEMNMFLSEKGEVIPFRCNFRNIDKESILKGNVIAVRDAVGQVLIYKNPRRVNFDDLLLELSRKEKIEKLKKVKKEIIKIEETEEEYELKGNRYKKFIIRNHRTIKKIHY